MGSASDWIKQIFNQSEALPSSDSDASSTLNFFVLFLKRHFAVENLLCFSTLASCDLSFFVGNAWSLNTSRLSNVNFDLMPVVV